MCGRYTLKTPPSEWGQLLIPLASDVPDLNVLGRDVTSRLERLDGWTPRYNIAPTQKVLALASDGGELALDYFRWGLVPRWSNDLAIGSRMINARAETIHEKKSFAGPFATQRCFVLADGYYEWQKLDGGKKQPCWIAPAEGGAMLLAGVWEQNTRATGANCRSCTIITTSASDSLASIHDRMPVVLDAAAAETWGRADSSVEELRGLLVPAPEGSLTVRCVSTLVNNVRNDSAECLTPLDRSV